MCELDSETIETDAGDYTVRWLIDETPEQPYDYGWTLYMPRTRWREEVDVTDAEENNSVPASVAHVIQSVVAGYFYAGEDKISGRAIVRYLSLLGLRATLTRDYYPVDPTDEFDGIAIAPSDIPAEHVSAAFDAYLSQWRAWAIGDAFGWELTDPSGNDVDSLWGFYDFDVERRYTLSEAREVAEVDASQRIDDSNRAGAGFVGIV